MNELIHSANAVSRISIYSILTHISLPDFAMVLALGIFIFIYLHQAFNGESIWVCIIVYTIVIGVYVSLSIFVLPSNSYGQLYQQKEQQFAHETLLPFVQEHTQTVSIIDYTCENSQKTNVYNLTKNKSRYPMTIYYKDSNGKSKTISGNMTIKRNGNSGLTLQVTYIGKSLTDSWGAGYYEPVLTIPIRSEFHCGKATETEE